MRVFRLELSPCARVLFVLLFSEGSLGFLPFYPCPPPHPPLGGLSYALLWSNLLEVKAQLLVAFRFGYVLSNADI